MFSFSGIKRNDKLNGNLHKWKKYLFWKIAQINHVRSNLHNTLFLNTSLNFFFVIEIYFTWNIETLWSISSWVEIIFTFNNAIFVYNTLPHIYISISPYCNKRCNSMATLFMLLIMVWVRIKEETRSNGQNWKII